MKTWFKRVFKKPEKAAYYFAHIPKTAGTSLIVLLDRYFPAESIMPEQLWRQVSNLTTVKQKNYRFIRGHFGGGGALMLTNRPIELLTMLRDPVELSYSTFEFIKREKNTVVHDLVHRQQLSFEDFLVHPDTQNLVSNRMVRYLSFDFNQDPSAQEVFLSPQTINDLQHLLSPDSLELNDQARFRRAKKWLDQALWYGVLDRFDDAIRLLCYRMKWPPVGESQKLNKHHQRPVISDLARQRVLHNNTEDSQLYQYAQTQFAQQYTAMLSKLGLNELSLDADIDQALDHYYQQHYLDKHTLAHSVYFDCGQVLLGQNWHRREWIEENQGYFRWSGPGELSYLDFWLEQNDYQVEIDIINALSDSFLNDLVVQINGHDINWSCDETGVVRRLQLSCPQRYIKANGLVRLNFICPQIMTHAEAFGSDDQRCVGFALKSVIIKP